MFKYLIIDHKHNRPITTQWSLQDHDSWGMLQLQWNSLSTKYYANVSFMRP